LNFLEQYMNVFCYIIPVESRCIEHTDEREGGRTRSGRGAKSEMVVMNSKSQIVGGLKALSSEMDPAKIRLIR
jgi:hypothetical protein